MSEQSIISTGIKGLDRSLDGLREGDTVTWQMEDIGDYMYVATQFVVDEALTGRPMVYLRFGDHDELIPTEVLKARGANITKVVLDPSVGFETFSVQVHRVVTSQPPDCFFLFDCLSELQRYWFSDLMVCNFFCLTSELITARGALCYTALRYERHTYETISRIRHATSVLLNIRTLDGCTYIHPVKANGRHSRDMFFPLRIHGSHCEVVTSSSETYAIFDIFTQTGERRDCWDSMFDSVRPGHPEPTDADGIALKENILRCLLGTEPQRLELCRKYFSVRDLMEIKRREIGTGCIGGKSVGMLLARNILRDTEPELYAGRIEPHDSYYIGADVFYTYAVQNNTWELRTRMIEPEDYIRIAPAFRERLLHGQFMPTIREQFLSMLEYFGQSPIIVRSSSILEDGIGNAFAGKYESVFCPNQGSLEERYQVFEDAVRTVYASTVSPEAIRYRADRNLLNRDEQMALLVMRVSGDVHGDYYYPHVGGVGHSINLYVNGPRASEENSGMLRMVFGLGTRAVDREADDYAHFVNLDAPTAPPMVEYGDEYRYSQHKVDVISLSENRFETLPLEKLAKYSMRTDASLFMEPDTATAARFREMGLYNETVPDILNFRKLLRRTDFAHVMKRIMSTIAEKYNYPVDVEYACNFTQQGEYRVNLLQCRTIQTGGLGQAGVMPQMRDFFWRTRGSFMGGNTALPVRFAVSVKVEPYLALPEQQKYAVARAVGELNGILQNRSAILIGPGRWGTTTPSLGVPVRFAEISHYSCICELAYSSHGLRPELSYGSHFFQDLVESGIFYCALYPGVNGCEFDEALFDTCPNRYTELTGDTKLEEVIRVYDLGERTILYSEIKSQECVLGTVDGGKTD
ncbi:MAG: PEP/pyruvate-binding domain-containing protein [Oscillospiraceae bacterium]|nr:PEP/pyruvate-binding domain-containing protein [Oscillospiraceae bacterium]